jgi:hypothetical protein
MSRSEPPHIKIMVPGLSSFLKDAPTLVAPARAAFTRKFCKARSRRANLVKRLKTKRSTPGELYKRLSATWNTLHGLRAGECAQSLEKHRVWGRARKLHKNRWQFQPMARIAYRQVLGHISQDFCLGVHCRRRLQAGKIAETFDQIFPGPIDLINKALGMWSRARLGWQTRCHTAARVVGRVSKRR